MNTSGAEREIHFDDPELEHSSIIAVFLNLIVNTSLANRFVSLKINPVDGLLHLHKFLIKHGGNDTLKRMMQCLRLRGPSILPLHRFILGSILDDMETCVNALYTTSRSYPDDKRFDLDIWCIPFDDYKRIPRRYAWALVRAWDHMDPDWYDSVDTYQLVEHFMSFYDGATLAAVVRTDEQTPSNKRRRS